MDMVQIWLAFFADTSWLGGQKVTNYYVNGESTIEGFNI
jgi:hypothetical protein